MAIPLGWVRLRSMRHRGREDSDPDGSGRWAWFERVPEDDEQLATKPQLPDPDTVEIPDDIGSVPLLQSELLRWRERARSGPAPSWPTPAAAAAWRSWRHWGLGVPVALGFVILFAGLASLASTLVPQGLAPPATSSPLAATEQPVGAVGGRLPDVVVEQVRSGSQAGGALAIRDLRPALLVAVPDELAALDAQGTPTCDCEPLLDALYLQAKAYGIDLALVGSASAEPGLRALDRVTGNTGAAVLLDGAALRAAIPVSAQDLAVVVVGADGLIHANVAVATTADQLAQGSAPPRLEPLLGRAAEGQTPVVISG